jgi:RNA polymerase sigma factor for flagellar operon FliA
VYGPSGRTEAVERRIDGLDRDECCLRYQGRVLAVARRLGERLPPNCPLTTEDLAAYGAIGLLEAFDRFDAGRGILFSTFAEYRIRGAMMDALRQNDSFTRYRRQMARQMDEIRGDLAHELGRQPEPEELAEALDVPMETFWHMQETTQPISYVSLFDGEGGDGEDSGRSLAEVLMGADGDDPMRALIGRDARWLLKAAIKELSERKRQCVVLYYGRQLNLSEIARVFDVTPSRISQILSAARRELREMLEDQVDLGDLDPGESRPGHAI